MPDDQYIDPLHEAAERVIEIFSEKEVRITTVESCTGGMISAALTDIAGSSNVLDRGYVTYSNTAKEQMVGVPEELIEKHGGGVRGGMAYGATDEFGFKAVENQMHVHDLHATVLHQLGLDHKRLTFRFQGRDFRLTDVQGNVIQDALA